MPPIKNWTKEDDTVYRYDPDGRFEFRLTNIKDAVVDGRHSLWFGELWFLDDDTDGVVPVEENIVDAATTKRRARKEAVSWMRDHPELPDEYFPEERTVEA